MDLNGSEAAGYEELVTHAHRAYADGCQKFRIFLASAYGQVARLVDGIIVARNR